MEFNEQSLDNNSILALEAGQVSLSHVQLSTPCFISKSHTQAVELTTLDQLDKRLVFELCHKDEVDLLLVGIGDTAQFLSAQQQLLIQQMGIGVESMKNDSACRSFNLLLSDARSVGVLLL